MTTLSRLYSLPLLALWAFTGGQPAALAGSITGNFIVGQWSNPIFRGCTADAVNRSALSCSDNTTSAVYSIANATTTGGPLAKSVLTEGANLSPQPGDPPISSSVVTFIGGTIPASRETVPFVIGSIAFTNGTSFDDTGIYGATLNLFASNGFAAVFIGSETVQFNTTFNTGTNAQNADYLTFSGLAGLSFEVYEQATASGSLFGLVIGDPETTLTGLTIDPGQSQNGFIGTDAPLPLPTPEPATVALIGSALTFLAASRHRKILRAAVALSTSYGSHQREGDL